MRKTKIVCTLGPATDNEDVLRKLMLAGMNVARLNFSHGTHEEQKKRMDMVKKLRAELGLPIAILLDTKGPEIRTRDFEGGKAELKAGDFFTLTTRDLVGDSTITSITYKDLYKDVQIGTHILIDDGLIELQVTSISGEDILCTVITGGPVSNHKGINVPDVHLNMPYLSEVDQSDILFGIEQDVDFIAASFVRSAKDVLEIRELLNANGGNNINIISKIENSEGVNHIDDIIYVSDGIMVARGDMGVEIPAEQVPFIQKTIIRKCNEACKPVITATQMLDSMIRNPRPTRAEVTDVANAVYDGTDAIMLSGETAMGKYPVEALRMMVQIAKETESHLDYSAYRERRISADNRKSISNAVCFSSVSTAHDLEAQAIIAPSISGFTARLLSKYRPSVRIIGLSPSASAVRQMQIYWGVTPFMAKRAESTDILIASSVDLLKNKGVLKSGDVAVVTAGVVNHEKRHEPAQHTNIMRIVKIL